MIGLCQSRVRSKLIYLALAALSGCGGGGGADEGVLVGKLVAPFAFDSSGNQRLVILPEPGTAARYASELRASGISATERFCVQVVMKAADGTPLLTPGGSRTFVAVFAVPPTRADELVRVGYRSFNTEYRDFVVDTFDCASRGM